MNIDSTMIYWITRLDNIRAIFFGMILLSILFGPFYGLLLYHSGYVIKVRNFSWFIVAFLLGVVGMAFTPSLKEMAAIVVIPKVANSEIVEEVGDTTKELISTAKDWVKDIGNRH